MNDVVIFGILGFSLVMMLEFLKAFCHLCSPLRKNLLASTVPEKKIFVLLVSKALLAVTLPLPQIYLSETLNDWDHHPEKVRSSLVAFCLVVLTLWPVFLFSWSFLSVNSILILGFGLILSVVTHLLVFLPFRDKSILRHLKALAKVIICFALVGLSFEFTLRWAPLMQSWGSQNGVAYFLADGRFSTLAEIIVLGLLCSLAIPFESWYWIWPLILYMSGQLSLNGAMAFFVSGIIGILLSLGIKKKVQSPLVRKMKREGMILGIFCTLLGFVLFGFLKGNLLPMVSENPQNQKIFLLLVGWLVILLPLLAGLMVWGHFKALQKSRL